ncbi:MAG TPA: hypothetical protein V6D22_24675 [Candidatus Obscuribacterales bacterium]
MGVVIHGYISARDRKSRVAGGRSPKLVAVERALAHVKYIQHRPGDDRDPGGRKFFDELDENLDGRALRAAIKELEDSKVVIHKLTLAPEIDPLDKRQYTREVMHRLAAEKGLDLNWMGVEHNNTAHHHIHVVVLGKDKNGRSVRIEREDYAKLREWGDRYLERWQPEELQRARNERKRKERERIEARKLERELHRQERIKEGLELPWIHKKIIREQYEPYSKWVKEQEDASKDRKLAKTPEGKTEKPFLNDSIQAAGKDWSKQNSLSELRELNTYLWDNKDERLPRDEYKKLVAWIKEKERLREREPDKASTETDGKQKDFFEYQGKCYSERAPYDKLAGLNNKLREDGAQKLPIDDYQKLRGWIEKADRARWAGVVERQLEISKQRYEREGAAKTSPNANRYVNPVQQQMMANPVVGLFMQGASVANELVRWIDLRDHRDPLAESKDEMERAKKNKHQEYVQSDRTHEQRARDKETIDNIDRALDENQEARKKRRKDKERDSDKRDRGLDFMR